MLLACALLAACGDVTSPPPSAVQPDASADAEVPPCGGCLDAEGACNHGGAFDDDACGVSGAACVRCASTCNAGACEELHCVSDQNCPARFKCVRGLCVDGAPPS